jgi:HD-GYP domain-containing protein (c-di-GMP phosphodiesterase class II)
METTTESDGGPTLVFHGPLIHPDELTSIGDQVRWRSIEALFSNETDIAQPIVVIADESSVDNIVKLRSLPDHIVVLASDAASERALANDGALSIAGIADVRAISHAVISAARLSRSRRDLEIEREHGNELMRLGVDLMIERDRPSLLRHIVDEGKRLTSSDAGVLLLAEESDDGGGQLRTVYFGFDTIPDYPNPNETFPIDEATLIGRAALTLQPIVVADVYDISAKMPLEVGVDFDERYHYHRKSMLFVPMVDQRGHLVGMLMFVNRKTDPRATIRTKADADRFVIAYTDREVLLVRALASLAAAALESARLYAELEAAFEHFVRASVTAIDQRDPATAGHSIRVAELSMALAEAAARTNGGITYRDVRFTPRRLRELRFAALLHDFGKIAVRESVLLKSKKLPPVLWQRVMDRFDLIATTLNAAQRDRLEQMRAVVRAANEPTVTPEAPAFQLSEIARQTFVAADGREAPYLTPDELHYLEIPKGTLDARERAHVKSHPGQTYRFLAEIPWPDDLAHLTSYAAGHHEKLDGKGYPLGLKGDEIPLQTRIITVADSFDALTATDRPYRPAVTAEKALEILDREAKAGHMDADLVRIMRESRPDLE